MGNLGLQQLGQLVYEYCGLNYLNNLPSLEMKTAKRLQELDLTSMWSYLRVLEESKAEWDLLIEVLTINETYFYREDKQLLVFQHKVLPSVLSTKPTQPIKVWSAACSTGEEPYSLAMTVVDSGMYSSNEVRIVGTDINKKVLQFATAGMYSKRSLSFRRIPQTWLETYFTDVTDEYEVRDTIKQMVSFKYLNLLDEEKMSDEQEYDVIFCRNVFIYFDQETIKKIATSFYHSLKKGGLLFLGHAETISNMGIGFETINTDGTFYYRKG